MIGYAGKHAAEILTMSLEGFMDSRRILTTLAFTAADKNSKPSAERVSKKQDDYQALDRMVAQNTVAIKVRDEIQRSVDPARPMLEVVAVIMIEELQMQAASKALQWCLLQPRSYWQEIAHISAGRKGLLPSLKMRRHTAYIAAVACFASPTAILLQEQGAALRDSSFQDQFVKAFKNSMQLM